MTYEPTRQKRQHFPKEVQRAALKRSGGLCEAVGEKYGLPPGVRCNVNLAYGLHFEHINPDSNGGKPTLDNCLATCPKCNLYKAHKFDTPLAAKTLRQSDKHHGITGPKRKIPSRPFRTNWKPNTKFINADMEPDHDS